MDSTVGALIAEFLRQGVLGLVIVGFLLGWVVPKWVIDELRAKDALKDQIIERQSLLIEKLAARGSIRTAKENRDDAGRPDA